MVGPSKQFDQNEVLLNALEVFWYKGYEATSMQELVDAMGINRASIYATFGNKHSIFSAALNWYCDTTFVEAEEILNSNKSPLNCIIQYFQYLGEKAGSAQHHGCFLSNTAVELGPHNEEIAKKVRDFWQQLEKLLRQKLEQSIQVGELRHSVDTLSTARLLNTLIQGLIVKSKVSVPGKQLTETVKTMFSLLVADH